MEVVTSRGLKRHGGEEERERRKKKVHIESE